MLENLLLNSKISNELYNYAKQLPIIDYHNHLSLSDIREDKRFDDVYDLWIKPDPYKHRAMRMCGVPEEYISGCASPEEKFIKWCETIPKLMGNPLYHWSLMELSMVFGIQDLPSGENAKSIYERCNAYLKEQVVSVSTLLDQFNVEFACPCVSLTDDVDMFEDSERFAPSLRGDDIVNLSVEFIQKMERVLHMNIRGLQTFQSAVTQRLLLLKKCGCVFVDHALDNGFTYYEDDRKNEKRFARLLKGKLDGAEKEKLSSYLLRFLCGEYARLQLVVQLHIGAQRYTSSKLREQVGPAGGFAGIGNSVDVMSLTSFLDAVDRSEYGLPKIVLFTLNPADNALISVLSGSYSKDGVDGLITQGPAWWWCDHKLGIEDMLENAAAFSALSNFIGMTTDSRSFLSFVRHDYFRRILCNWIGEKIEKGEWVSPDEHVKDLLERLCYGNAKKQFS